MSLHQNPSECFAAELAQKTFLRFWSFPNPYRLDGNVPKEICDLLVVQGNAICVPRLYVLVIAPRLHLQEVEYREYRKALLGDYALVAACHFRHEYRPVIGIAMEHPSAGVESFDACLIDVREWTPEMVSDTEALKAKRGFFRSDMRTTHGSDKEFSDIEIVCHGSQHSVKVPRNSPCPCGSGKKFKKCCGPANANARR
jgi:hypothetical protein